MLEAEGKIESERARARERERERGENMREGVSKYGLTKK